MTFSEQWIKQQEAEREARGEETSLREGGPMVHRDTTGGYDLPTKQREHGTEHRTVDSVMINREELERLRRSDELLTALYAAGIRNSDEYGEATRALKKKKGYENA